MTAAIPAPERRLFHVVERHTEPDKREQKRKRAAMQSWDTLYVDNGVIPVHYYNYERDARMIGDQRDLPFLKDALKFGMAQASLNDILFFTNDDVWLHPSTADLLLFQTSVYGACCAQRVDFSKPIPSGKTPDELAEMGHKHFGRDLFAFTMEWLTAKWDEIGDFLIGASDFDLCLCAMIRKDHGLLSTKRLFKDIFYPSEIPLGYVCHCIHQAKWTEPKNIDTGASQRHNRSLFRAWGEKHCPTLKFCPGDVVGD